MSQCLRNKWVTRERHTLAQTPLRMHKTPDVTPTGAWNNLKHHRGCCHYIGHSYYTGIHHKDCCRYPPGHHQPPSWLEYDGVTDIMLHPLNKECSRQARRSTTRWLLWYQRVRYLTTITLKTNLDTEYKWHEYVILPYPYAIRPYLWLHWGVSKHIW